MQGRGEGVNLKVRNLKVRYVPCPHSPRSHRHRRGDGWLGDLAVNVCSVQRLGR